METLDVTVIEPRLKHPTIFEKFDALVGGDAFIIHNDHDPKPLYYQMIAERGQVFEWEYLEEGPETWEVKITKLNIGEKPKTIGELVANDFRKAEIFRKFGLDFCCAGKKSVKDACNAKGIDAELVQKSLDEIDAQVADHNQDYKSWDLGFLADYVLNTHHKYVVDSLPILYQLTEKVARRHGEAHPELIEIERLFNIVADELTDHMVKEENILFPYIKELALAKKNNTKMESSPFGSIENPIRMMESEHTLVGGVSERMNELSNGYTPPSNACASYSVLFHKLNEFEKDLHQHIHLENNILFPGAIELEKELLN